LAAVVFLEKVVLSSSKVGPFGLSRRLPCRPSIDFRADWSRGKNPQRRGFLGHTYNLKAIADHETGPGSEVSPELAAEAIADGKRFVAKIVELIETT